MTIQIVTGNWKFDNLVKSLEMVIPCLIPAEQGSATGIQNVLNVLDSGLAVIPDPDPGRNDGKENFTALYESIKLRTNFGLR